MLIDVLNETLSSRLDSFVQETKAKPLEDETTNIDTHDIQDAITGDGVNALKEWTGKGSATIVYDSTVDEFTDDAFFNSVRGKPNIAVVGFTTDGDVFGGFYSVAVTEHDWVIFDPNVFIFSFESHGRCETPRRFDVKGWLRDEANVRVDRDNVGGFVTFWADNESGGGFTLGNEKSSSYCVDLSLGFEGIEDTTLTGRSGSFPNNHHCARLVTIQMT